MHKSAFEHPPGVDEFDAADLEKAPSVVVQPPRVALAPVSMECKLEREFTVGEFHDHVVWGRVVRFHIRDDVYLEGGRIDTAALATAARRSRKNAYQRGKTSRRSRLQSEGYVTRPCFFKYEWNE
jgi:flavin reductase (DIM6/NTAB) family NADH-FMN oxidoreductase RutF